MLCRRDSIDPLATLLFKEYDLSLVKTARAQEELFPGTIVRTFPKDQNRHPAIDSWDNLFSPSLTGKVKEARFSPVQFTKSGTLTSEIIAELSMISGASAEGVAELKAALEKSGARSFQIDLSGGIRRYLDESLVEAFLPSVTMTDNAKRYYDEGQKLFFVKETVSATSAVVTSGSDLSACLEAIGAVPAAAKGRLQASLGKASTHSLVFSMSEANMVIGFRALALVRDDDVVLFRGIEERVRILGREGSSETTNEFATGEDSGSVFYTIDHAR